MLKAARAKDSRFLVHIELSTRVPLPCERLGGLVAKAIRFRGRVLLLGSGAVSRCLQIVMLRDFDLQASSFTVMDCRPLGDVTAPIVASGARFIRHRLTPENLAATLKTYLSSGDLLINLTCSVSSQDLIAWCHDHGVLYIDTSVEVWDPGPDHIGDHSKQTLYFRHHELRRLAARWPDRSPTAIVEHGANPGLVSHWVKRALLEISEQLLISRESRVELDVARRERLRDTLAAEDFARLAMESGIKVIQISERDTQITTHPKEVGEFANTWSIEGFHEEGTAPAEMGWGTHEWRIPQFGHVHESGLGNQIYLTQAGIDTYVRSWVPLGGPIIGMVIRHGEAFTISDRLTVRSNGQVIYRPTVYYAYLPSDAALASLHELRMSGYRLQSRQRIMHDDISSGIDEVGVLLLGHDLNGWWVGSQLGIDEARALVPNQNATTLQVAASVLGAIGWIVQNPRRGLCVPDDLDHRYVLDIAAPYLGPSPSVQTDWSPLTDRLEPFADDGRCSRDESAIWQFESFLFPYVANHPASNGPTRRRTH